ncbi:MAG: YdbL family protein [Verrucomicrobiota bacterium]|nr:YdbL family protein [Verrucomicrobiota bacterium]
MKMKNRFFTAIFSLFILGALLSPAIADELDDLKKRFKERAPFLGNLKVKGKLGETDNGYVEPVKGAELSAEDKKLMQAENRDRRTGYDIISKKRNIPQAKVGQLAGAKKIKSAKTGEWVKQGGSWKKK